MFSLFRNFQLFYMAAAAVAKSHRWDLPAPSSEGLGCSWASHWALAAKIRVTSLYCGC